MLRPTFVSCVGLLNVKQFDTWKGINIIGSLLNQYLVVEVKLTKYEMNGNNLIVKLKIEYNMAQYIYPFQCTHVYVRGHWKAE